VVENALRPQTGVIGVDANPAAQNATVTYDPELTSVKQRWRVWRGPGFDCGGCNVPADVIVGAGRSDGPCLDVRCRQSPLADRSPARVRARTERRRQGIAERFALLPVLLHRELSPSQPLIEELVAPGALSMGQWDLMLGGC
jgi:hypothetical protein